MPAPLADPASPAGAADPASPAAISATHPDWSRETPQGWWDPPRRLLRALRRWQAARARRGPAAALARRWWALQHRIWSTVTGAEIPLTTRIGGGLLIPHPNGIVIFPDTEIGPNCLIFQQVTLGTRGGPGGRGGAPRLEGHVDIGAGARVLGPVTLGAHAVIGANAVVLQDVPPGRVAVGIPARLLPPQGTADGGGDGASGP